MASQGSSTTSRLAYNGRAHLREASANGQPVRANALLTLDSVTKSWPTVPRPVLNEVDLVLAPGTAIHIAGANGAGKTTLLRVITGLIKPEAGNVRLDGLDPERQRPAYQRRLGFLPAGDRGLYARLSVRRHLDFWARISFLAGVERREAIEAAIVRSGLGELAGRRVDRLSMGQRQRVRLAGLILHRPRLLLLDEPRNSLDEEGIELMCHAFSEVIGDGGGVIWCSPVGDRNGFPFDREYLLHDGDLVEQ